LASRTVLSSTWQIRCGVSMKRNTFRSKTAVVAAVFAGTMVLASCSGISASDESGDGGDGEETFDAGSEEVGGDPIVIGMINDTSGGASAYSPYATVGIEVAIEKINEDGGVAGRPLSLISESDGSDSTQTSTLARRLIDN